jgi:hypothetical protein
MARYKGRRSPAVVERDFPNIVEMPVPPGGLGKRLDAMHDFHTGRNIQSHRGRGRHEEGQDFIRWCFADPIVAEVFAAEFGGKCIRRKRLQDSKAMRKKQIQNLTKSVLHPCCMEKIARYEKALKHADFIVMDEIGPDSPGGRTNSGRLQVFENVTIILEDAGGPERSRTSDLRFRKPPDCQQDICGRLLKCKNC